LYTWGYGREGQLGHGTTANVLSPQPVTSLRHVVSIAAGYQHALALTGVFDYFCMCMTTASADGSVYAWGKGEHGRLGVGGEKDHLSPVRVESLCGRGVRHVYAGEPMSGALLGAWCVCVYCVIRDCSFAGNGQVFTWGNNLYGQLGLGDAETRLTPTAVSFPDDEAVEELYFGSCYVFARVGVCVCVCMCVPHVTCVWWVSVRCMVRMGRQRLGSAGSRRHGGSHCPHPRGERVLTRGSVAVVWR
jgi:hypothetical protein